MISESPNSAKAEKCSPEARVAKMGQPLASIARTIPRNCSEVFPAQKTTSGRPVRNSRWVSSRAKPNSSVGKAEKESIAWVKSILPCL